MKALPARPVFAELFASLDRSVGASLAIGAALALALWLRVRDLGAQGLWLDEIGTLWTCRGGSLAEVAARASAVQGQSPLFYVLLRSWLAVVGESALTLRLPSALLGTLACALAGLGAREAFGRRAGAIALLLAATHPALVGHARDARPYALAGAATLLAFVGVARAARTGQARDRALGWAGAVLAVAAHYLFLPVLVACALAFLRTARREALRRVVLEGLVAGAALLPLLPQALSLVHRRESLVWVESMDPRVLLTVIARPWRWPLAVALAWLALARRSRPAPGPAGPKYFLAYAAGGTIALLLALTALGTNAVAERYLAPAQVALVPLVALAFMKLPRTAGALLVAVAAGLGAATAPHVPTGHTGWAAAADRVAALKLSPAEPVVLASAFVEANQVTTPEGLTPRLRSFVTAPLEVSPGVAEPGRDYVLLPSVSRAPGLADYLERAVAPRLEGVRAFAFVGSPGFAPAFQEWLEQRWPKSFRGERVLEGDTVVVRYAR